MRHGRAEQKALPGGISVLAEKSSLSPSSWQHSCDALLALTDGKRRQEREAVVQGQVPKESELDVEWLAGGKRNQTAKSQLWFLTKGKRTKREKSVRSSITHHQQLYKIWALSLLAQMQRSQAARNPPFVIRIHLLAGGVFLSFLPSAFVCFFSFTLFAFVSQLTHSVYLC